MTNDKQQTAVPLLVLLWCLGIFLFIFEIIQLVRPQDFVVAENLQIFINPLFLGITVFALLTSVHLKLGSRGLNFCFLFASILVSFLYTLFLGKQIMLSWWFVAGAALLVWIFAWAGLYFSYRNFRALLGIWFVLAGGALFYLYLDRIFYIIFKLHINPMHIWRLQHTAVENSGLNLQNVMPHVFDVLAFITVSAMIFRFLRRGCCCLQKPVMLLFAVFLQLFCLYFHFNHIVEQRPFVEYLLSRFEASGVRFPLTSRLQPLHDAGLEISDFMLDPDVFYQNHQFKWKSEKRPNLIFITLESVRAEGIEENMPLLMQWAKKGLYLANHHSASNITETAINSIYGSMYPFFLAEQFEKIKPWGFTKFLQDDGYSLTKIYCKLAALYNEAFYRDFTMVPLPPPTPSQPIINYLPHEWFGSISEDHLQILNNSSELVLGELLKRISAEKRYFIEAYLFNAHFNYNFPSEFTRFQPILPERFMIHHLEPSPENLLGLRNRYRNALGYMDHLLNKFLLEFFKQGYNENTYIVIYGDHGQSLGEAGFFGHVSGPHHFQFKVPCLILGPNVRPQIYKGFSQHPDLLPTLADLMQYSCHGAFGRNLFKENREFSLEQENSVIDRFIIRRNEFMNIYELTADRRVRWVITIGNQFELNQNVYDLYHEPGIKQLKKIIAEDLNWLKQECRIKQSEKNKE